MICQQDNSSNTLPSGLLHPLLIPAEIWDDIAMDFITGLPNACGFTMIMVVIDRLSKYVRFVHQKAYYTSVKVAELFMQTVVKLHGFPKFIVSDKDSFYESILKTTLPIEWHFFDHEHRIPSSILCPI